MHWVPVLATSKPRLVNQSAPRSSRRMLSSLLNTKSGDISSLLNTKSGDISNLLNTKSGDISNLLNTKSGDISNFTLVTRTLKHVRTCE